MMRKRKITATGIDIGIDTIKVVQVVKHGKSFTVSNCALIPIKEYLKEGKLIHQPPKFLARMVKADLSRSKLRVQNPAITTSAEDVLYKYVFVPKSVKERMVSFLNLILSSQNINDINFGFSRIEGVSRREKNELVMVALVRNDTLEFIHKFHEGLVQGMNHSVPRPLALYNLITFMKEGTEGELHFCADISNDGLDMAIVAKVNAEKPASRLVFFRSVQRKIIEDNTTQGTYHAIHDEILQTLMACRRELKLSVFDISHFWVSGERCSDKGLTGYLGERLNKDVRALDTIETVGIKISDKKRSRGMNYDPRSMAVATGLALGALNRMPVYMRLVSRLTEIKDRAKRNLRYLKVAMFFVLATAGMTLYYSYSGMKVYKDNAAKAENALSAYINNESRLVGIAEGQRKLGGQLKKLKDICDKDFSYAALVKLLDIKIPTDITLKNVDIMTVGGFQSLGSSRWLRLEGEVKATEGGDNPLEILKSYVTNLEGVKGFKGVSFREIKELGNRTVTFHIECVTD